MRLYPQGERLRVSTEAGIGPVWSPNGRELFFHGPYEGTQRLMVASVAADRYALDPDVLDTATPRDDPIGTAGKVAHAFVGERRDRRGVEGT